MKSLFTAFFFLLIFNGLAQNQNLQDVVYLKDGSVIRGMIVEQIPNKAIKIQTYDQSIFVFEMEEIEKIKKEPRKEIESNAESDNTAKKSIEVQVPTQGFLYSVEFSGLFWDEDKGNDPIGLINSFSGQIGQFISLGGGFGFHTRQTGLNNQQGFTDQKTEWFFPVFLDFRVYPLPTKISPYINFNLGYTFYSKEGEDPYLQNFTDNSKATMNFGINVGGRIFFTEKSAITLSLGYSMQKFKTLKSLYPNPLNYSSQNFNYFSLKTGFLFY